MLDGLRAGGHELMSAAEFARTEWAQVGFSQRRESYLSVRQKLFFFLS